MFLNSNNNNDSSINDYNKHQLLRKGQRKSKPNTLTEIK